MEEKEKSPEERSTAAYYSQHPSLRKLAPLEKNYLLAVEHGDATKVERILQMAERSNPPPLDVNCKDAVGRCATLMAIDNENLDMLLLLLEHGVESRDALLHAINAEYVEAVDLLLEHEEIVHKEGEPHSWEKVDRDISSFTPEITPLILAAHKDNYEILKLLLDRGATLPMPHDVRCKCNECVASMEDDCLCHSRSRINAYRALSSPSVICLSSIDPVLTAFELSWELRRLSHIENEFKEDYKKLRFRCQDFATNLLDHARSSNELEVVLNYDPTKPQYQQGDHMPLTRVQMAIKYKQKKFIAHPNVQQLMSTLWYDGLPGFRKQNAMQQLWDIMKIGLLFPFYSFMYMLFPNNSMAKLIRKPFFKFIIHSFSYLFFLFLLILASQRVETLVVQWFGSQEMVMEFTDSMRKQRGRLPTILETSILLYIIAHIWQETRELWSKGLVGYFQNMWNIIDFTRNSFYVGTVGLRLFAYFQAQSEIYANPMSAFIPRELWDAFDPMLIADGLFAAANVFAALKLIHIFSINPYLGPLQISLARMVIDIIKFFFIYTLVLFAFACGLNQLLWYYADMERQQCFSGAGATENWTTQRDSCLAWRRFSNLFESSQSLFWASFGLVDLSVFELKGIKSYTRFWGLLMFGSYSVINVVVLLNLLIAMMSNSYNIISERADMEWKFARTTLFMNYFEEGNTVPPPFNIFPTMKNLMRLCGRKRPHKDMSLRRKETKIKERDTVYQNVMCNLVWRYVTSQQKAVESSPVTEDHINEVRQDVQSFKHDLMRVLRSNGMKIRDAEMEKPQEPVSVKIQMMKRRLMKDFSIGLMEVCTDEAAPEVKGNKSVLARLVGLSGTETSTSQRWRDLIQAAKRSKIIGNKDTSSSRFGSLRQSPARSNGDGGSNGCINQAYTQDETLQQSSKPEDCRKPLVDDARSSSAPSPEAIAPKVPLTKASTQPALSKQNHITDSPVMKTTRSEEHDVVTVTSQPKPPTNPSENLIDLHQGSNLTHQSKPDTGHRSDANVKSTELSSGVILSPQKLLNGSTQIKMGPNDNKKEVRQQKSISSQNVEDSNIPSLNAPKRQTTPIQGMKKTAAPAIPASSKQPEIAKGKQQDTKADSVKPALIQKPLTTDPPPPPSKPDTTIVVPSTPDTSPKRDLLSLPKAMIMTEYSKQGTVSQISSKSSPSQTEKQDESVLISLSDQRETKAGNTPQGEGSRTPYNGALSTTMPLDPQMLPCTTEVELRPSCSNELVDGDGQQTVIDEKEDTTSNIASTLKSGYVKIMEYRKGWI